MNTETLIIYRNFRYQQLFDRMTGLLTEPKEQSQ